MSSEESADQDEDKEQGSEASYQRYGQFNPMSNYFAIVTGIVVSYVLFFIFGYPALIMAMLFFVVQVLRETVEILDEKSGGFLRKAAYFNAGLTLIYFGILVVNGYALFRGSDPPIFPDIANLAFISPLLILSSLYGSKNIKGMIEARKNSNE